MGVASRSVMLRDVPSDIVSKDIVDMLASCVTVEHVARPTGNIIYLVLADANMVERALESLQGLSLGDWSLKLERVPFEREMSLSGYLQFTDKTFEGDDKQQVSSDVKTEQVSVEDNTGCTDLMSRFSNLSTEEQLKFLQSVQNKPATGTVKGGHSVGQTFAPLSPSVIHHSPISQQTGQPNIKNPSPLSTSASPFVPSFQNTQVPGQLPVQTPVHTLVTAPLPHLSQFSGEKTGKDVSYQQWKRELLDLEKSQLYNTYQLSQCIRRSLRGTASDVLLHLGESIAVTEVINKFDNVFGDILPPEVLYEKFYTARQQEGEAMATWACRLEDILSKLKARSPHITSIQCDDMLRTKFWSGLVNERLKNALRHRFDTGESYNNLLVSARIAELEIQQTPASKSTVNQQIADQSNADKQLLGKMDALLNQLEGIKDRLNRLEGENKSAYNSPNATQTSKSASSSQPRPFKGKCFKCKEIGHKARDCLNF